MLVDDNADLRETLALLLRCDGHLVIEAADGQLALDALESATTFHLIILDLMMPVMDGATFLARKAKGAHAAIPVLIFSSSESIGMEEFGNVVSVVSKMFPPSVKGPWRTSTTCGFPPRPASSLTGTVTSLTRAWKSLPAIPVCACANQFAASAAEFAIQ